MPRIRHLLLISALLLAGCNTGSSHPHTSGELPSCTVRSVLDGDSVTLVCDGERRQVRLYCIDAPEKEQRPWGDESRSALRSLLRRNDRVRVRIHDIDSYGRQVAEILHNGENINLRMVMDGHAAVYRRYCKLPAFHEAEAVARERGLGIWQKKGLHQTPWRWRHR
ncbi:MAG: thermonuclease family protein [Sedimenticolaceae bacterium]|nr:thermonuclease family protein [Sedimenticolaceae bacterium]